MRRSRWRTWTETESATASTVGPLQDRVCEGPGGKALVEAASAPAPDTSLTSIQRRDIVVAERPRASRLKWRTTPNPASPVLSRLGLEGSWASPRGLDEERRSRRRWRSLRRLARGPRKERMIADFSSEGRRPLIRQGQAVSRDRGFFRTYFLSSILALNVNGDGRVEYVDGGADGWIYALDVETGSLTWSLDLGSPVGDPIAAEFENGGGSEILVLTALWFLNAIGPR